ncbi:MAG: acetylxylan esterase [Paludibacteraceae bacterium]|nr:acetylxylan esterase [Paludibacteraceae bacterium]
MKGNYLYILLLCTILFGACGCEKKSTSKDEPKPEQKDTAVVIGPTDMSLIESSVPVTDNWVWSGKPQITIQITNGNPNAVQLGTKVVITTDKKAEVVTITDSVVIGTKSQKDVVVTTTTKLEPGIYHAECYVDTAHVRGFNFAIDPFEITSVNDKPADFDQFWQAAKDQLAAIDMNAQLKEIQERSTAQCKVYLVEMMSVPDGLSGEPVKIRGYYCEPQDGQKHPVILHFYGYDTQGYTGPVDCPYGSTKAEFYLSHRGQYLNNRPAGTNLGVDEATVNIYGDWFRYNLGEKDNYYYRGAYMDVVQAIRFMATREASDMTKLFAEGSSQGGALTYVAAALSDYPFTAIAANVAFMGDFADAKDIESLAYWEISDHYWVDGVPVEQSLRYLPYFDIKHLTPRISCPVLGSSGLADDVCPARLNLVPFNNLATPAEKKEYILEPEMGHSYPRNWYSKMNELFGKYF